MAQTLDDLDQSAAFSVEDVASIFAELPDLAVLYAQIVSGWSVVDSYIALAAASLIAGRAEVAMAMYEAISDSSGQYNMLYAAAEAALPGDDGALFKSALRKIRKLGKVRNQIAHGVVIRSGVLPDGFGIAEQKQFAEMTKVFFTPPQPGETREEQVRKASRKLTKSTTVFRKIDLKLALDDIEKASTLALDLSVLASPFHHRKDEARQNLLKAVGSDASV